MKNRILQFSISLLVSLFFLYLVIYKPHLIDWSRGNLTLAQALFGDPRIHWSDFGVAFTMLRPVPAILGALLLAMSLFLRTFRWRLMIRPVGDAGYWTVFHAQNVGYLMNNVLPMRAGELLRAVAVARKADLSASSVLSTVVVERILDFFGLAFLFGLSVAFFPFPDWLRGGGILLVAGVTVALAVLVVMSRHVERVERLIDGIIAKRGRLVKRLGGVIVNLAKGLAAFQSSATIMKLLVQTILLWIVYAGTMQVVLFAFGFSTSITGLHTSWLPGAILTVVTTLGLAVPSAPGAVGTYHAAALAGLAMLGIEGGVAVVFATFLHALMIIVLNLFGVIGLFGLRLSPKDLLRQSRKIEEKPLPKKIEPEHVEAD